MSEKTSIKGAMGVFIWEIKNINVNRVQDLVMMIIMSLIVKNRISKGEDICIKFYYY